VPASLQLLARLQKRHRRLEHGLNVIRPQIFRVVVGVERGGEAVASFAGTVRVSWDACAQKKKG